MNKYLFIYCNYKANKEQSSQIKVNAIGEFKTPKKRYKINSLLYILYVFY